MSLNFPRPRNYPYNEVFYYDGTMALMLGKYKRRKNYSLGMRWTEAESPLGYPNIFGKGMWMVVPDKLAYIILEGLNKEYDEEVLNGHILNRDEFLNAIEYFRNNHPQK